jgi:hypothetical protein
MLVRGNTSGNGKQSLFLQDLKTLGHVLAKGVLEGETSIPIRSLAHL